MERLTDEEIRNMAEDLGDWIANDAIIHIPKEAAVQRDYLGAWVDCKILVPSNQKPSSR